jgi:U3 small nucleolar RNA-associated protein 21
MEKSLYVGYKAVGYVTDGVPFVVQQLGDETFIVTSIGKSFQVYRIDKLTICLVSKAVRERIKSLQAVGHETFVASGNSIIVYSRNRVVNAYEISKSAVRGTLVIGKVLLAYDDDNVMTVIDTKQREKISSMTLLNKSNITCMVHPATYLNKVVVGFADGALELWNFNKSKLVYSFSSHQKRMKRDGDTGSKSSFAAPAVTCLQQSPACDVLGIGFSNGDIHLMNLKLDVVLFSFRQEGGAVTSLSFRTDVAAEKFPFMASGSEDGRIHIWNLGSRTSKADVLESLDLNDDADDGKPKSALERKLEYTLENAHLRSVSKVEFLHGEPILVSSSGDNSLKIWIFDSPEGSTRLLKSREGHSGYPMRIRYYGGVTNASARENADGMSCEMVSCGSDSTMRLFNTALESQNREMSQQPILKKIGYQRRNERLPMTIGYDFSETRERDWGNLVSIHKNHSNAYVWRFRHRVVTDLVLRQTHWPTNNMRTTIDRNTHATAVALTPCGNYCLVGYRGGFIHMYNLQSGNSKGSFPESGEENLGIRERVVKARRATPGNVLNIVKNVVNEGKGGAAGSLKMDTDTDTGTGDDKIGTSEGGIHEADRDVYGHTQEVTGVFVDIASTVVVSCGLDGEVIFWDFQSRVLSSHVCHGVPHVRMVGFADAGFVAVAGQDRTVRVFDIAAQKMVRCFPAGHSREVTDMAFSPDGRRLLTSSMDATVRVWDLPSGRCLSWMQFDAPVLSLAMSHSGEYLCIAQAGKEGIFMYVDRSLYENVHFWKEPIKPTPLEDSLVRVANGQNKLISDVDNHEEDAVYDDEENDNNDDDDNDDGGDENGEQVRVSAVVTPTQAQVSTDKLREEAAQRGEGTVTLSAVPRAYWTSLFHLELIKERNKPIAAPTAPAKAPFFLPSIVREGSTPSFPTPEEFSKIASESYAAKSADVKVAKGDSDDAADADSGKKTERGSKKQAEEGAVDMKSEDDIMAELAGMGSTWEDNADGNDDWGDVDAEGVSLSRSKSSRSRSISDTEESEMNLETFEDRTPDVSQARSTSRIFKKQKIVRAPRCRLVSFLLPHMSGFEETAVPADGADRILDYLKSLSPSAIDVEFRMLCTNDEDEEGMQYVKCLLEWIAGHFHRGTNFDLLQAYLHRLLLIYSESLLKQPNVKIVLDRLLGSHAQGSERLRDLVQNNLCLLKLFTGVSLV